MTDSAACEIDLGTIRNALREAGFADAQIVGDPSVTVSAIAYDSRAVKPGALFVALTGFKTDGHNFLPNAIGSGASAVMVEGSWLRSHPKPLSVPIIGVSSTRSTLPFVASALYANPSRSFALVGVTGTNGKTSITHMIDSIMRAAGKSSAVVGTVGVQMDGQPIYTHWSVSTTPESSELQALFADFRDRKVDIASMEVTSIAIDQERTAACEFDTMVFSNLTQDHLDYHGTMQAYIQSKERLFTEYVRKYAKPHCTAAINLDDPVGERYAAVCKAAGGRPTTYGIQREDADIVAKIGRVMPTSTAVSISNKSRPGKTLDFELNVGGLFNVSNALAAVAVARIHGIDDQHTINGLSKMRPVPGRFESVPTNGRGFDVIVDYAHTPDGLENVLSSARRLNPVRLIAVFGCGGDRDKTKRPIMGEIAVRLADKVIVTSDNPRTETPNAIIEGILEGIEGGTSNGKVVVEPDRHAAIKIAINEAGAGDLVVIAGKGHETYQLIGDKVLDFDDRKVAAEVLAR